MRMLFEELNDETRRHMLREFTAEQASPNPYRSQTLSTAGLSVFPQLMADAIRSGNEESLMTALSNPTYWSLTETYVLKGVMRQRKVNLQQAAERLALTEFNTWYVRGLSRRLLDEGVSSCQIYRGAEPKWAPAECTAHEGMIVHVRQIYDGHRARYWPEPGNSTAFSIPFGPGCHHTIRRVK